MNKKLWILLGAALVASVLAASAQSEVLSQNAVGYVKKTLPAGGKLVAVSYPLESMTSQDIVFGETSLATEMPVGSYVHFWDEVNQSWEPGVKAGKGWAALQAQKVIAPGEAFFIQGNPAGAADVEVTMTGEVPTDASMARAIVGGNALGTVGNPYPVDFIFGTSAVAEDAPVGTYVHFWSIDNQSWEPGVKAGKGWAALQASKVVEAGEGFFLQQPGAGDTWVATKSYTWP